MKKKKDTPLHPVVDNVRKIIADKGLQQYVAAEMAGTTASQFSKILAGEVQLSLWNISNFATSLGMNIIDVFTYPDIYINKSDIINEKENTSLRKNDEVKATLTIELKKSKRDEIMKLLFGDKDIEIIK